MQLRSYNGRSVAEAIAKCRKDFGDEALIVETRRLSRQGMLGANPGTKSLRPAMKTSFRPMHPNKPARPPPAPVANARQSAAVGVMAFFGRELSAIRQQLDRLIRGQDGGSFKHCSQAWQDAMHNGELPEEYGQEGGRALGVAGDRLPNEHRLSFAARFLAQAIHAPVPVPSPIGCACYSSGRLAPARRRRLQNWPPEPNAVANRSPC